jgi:stress response protein YsnF
MQFRAIAGYQTDTQSGLEGTVPFREEELVVHKELVQHGEVRFHMQVVINKAPWRSPETRGARHREIRRSMRWRPPDESGSAGSVASELRTCQPGQVVRLVLEEEPVIHKRTVVYKEVVIGKSLVPEIHQVTLTSDARSCGLTVQTTQ